MKKSLTLKYGDRKVRLSLSSENFLGYIRPKKWDTIVHLEKFIRHALDHPFDSPGFDRIFKKGERVTIIVSDISRYTGCRFYFPILLERLNRLGIPDKDITVVFALGIHRKQTQEEQKKILGEEVFQRVMTHDHDAWDKNSMISLGTTRRGTVIDINRLVAEADRVIATGTIGFHYFAGFSGGRKSILPGVSSHDSCVANHDLVFNSQEEGGGRHPRAQTGILSGNPVHEDMVEACQALKSIFLINTIISPEGKIIKLVSGNPISAHQEGCNFFWRNFSIPVSRKADLVIVSCGGAPHDLNFIQAHKSMDYAMGGLREGGVMILLAKCEEGFGNSTFHDWFKYQDLNEFARELRKNYEINGQTAYATLIKAKRAKIILVSNLDKNKVKEMSLTPADSLEEGISFACRILGKRPSIYVIPQGGITLPRHL